MTKRIITVLLIISICFLAFFIVSTYAKYSTETEDILTNGTLTKWNIKINTSNIKDNSNFSANLVPVIEQNDHIDSNIIAPTSSGYFDIVIDSSNTDLPFSYIMSFNYADTEIEDFRITEYSLDGGATKNPMPLDDITGGVAASVNSTTYRFFVEWDDSNTNITDNEGDTQLALNGANSQINVTISLQQTSI